MRSLRRLVVATIPLLLVSGTALAAPGNGVIVSNPYGPMTVQGATQNFNNITGFTDHVVIQLGPQAGTPGVVARIDFDGFNLAPGSTFVVRSGAPGQVLVLANTSATPAVIAGGMVAQSFAATPAFLYLKSASGMTIAAQGAVASPELHVDTLGVTWTDGAPLVNNGVLEGTSFLDILGADISGVGQFRGDAMAFHTFGNARQPRSATHFLQNGLHLQGGQGSLAVALTINAYGSAPQALNFWTLASVSLAMPSQWDPGSTFPANNAVVRPGGVRAPGVPDPSYGGGSMIVQSQASITLAGPGSGDFAFPGAIVLKALGPIDLNSVPLIQGWTTSGRGFQGIFLESPDISGGGGLIGLYTNDLNWVNFSTRPKSAVRVFQLARQPDDSAAYVPADATAPHMNTYSIIANTAADGGCWTCLIDPAPIDVYEP